MKKILSFAALLLAFVSLSWGHDFSAVAPSGQTLYYYINNESTVSVACPGAVYSWNGFTEPSGSLVIPSTVTYNSHTYSVTSIDRRAFAACSGITSVTIPNSVTTIGDHAFDGCIGLTSVTIPNSVTSIGNCAFKACRGLTSVTIGNSVTSIGHEAFHDCSGITSVTIPNSVTSIGYGAFYLVRNIVYNGTATGSSWGALCVNGYIEGDLVYTDSTKTHLAGCVTTATSVAIPNSVTTIGDHAFDGCIGLTSVTIPNSVTSIGDGAFYDCNSLASVIIPNSVTSIGDGAFYDCNSLASVIISNSVTSIGKYAFSNCSGLTNVTIPNSVTSIGNNAFEFVRNIVYHGTATGSPWGALCVNGYIEGDLVYTDSSKTYLVGCATTATSVTIPNSVTYIGRYAFIDCNGITEITSIAYLAPHWDWNTFDSVTPTIPVYIPCGCSYSYLSRWSYFSNFVESAEILLNTTTSDSTQGIVRVQTEPTCDNPTAVIFAAANTGYSFDHWSDGNTDNPRTITVTADATYIAYFESTQGIEDVDGNDITVRVVNGHIVIAGTGDEPVRLFDCMGRLIHIERQPSESCDFIVPTTGIYLIQIGTHRAQKVAVLW